MTIDKSVSRMSGFRYGLVIALGVAALALLAFYAIDDRFRYTVNRSSGSVTSGEKFGISIGSDIETARKYIQDMGLRNTEDSCKYILLHKNSTRECRSVFMDTGIRTGFIILRYSSGKVRKISWSYSYRP
mgnify:CR=1 FL=1